MRQIVIPILAPLAKPTPKLHKLNGSNGDEHQTKARGLAVLLSLIHI